MKSLSQNLAVFRVSYISDDSSGQHREGDENWEQVSAGGRESMGENNHKLIITWHLAKLYLI